MKTSIYKSISLALWIVFTGIIVSCTSQPNEISIQSLLQEMTNREVLAKLPEVPYKLGQFSSYDRNAVAPDSNWFANDDRNNYIRAEFNQGRKEFVLMDFEGPGAIVRFWMTFAGKEPGSGTLRFYFDNDTIPEVEGPVLDLLSGQALVGEPLATSVSDLSPLLRRGHNLYLPVPFQKNCKVTYETKFEPIEGKPKRSGEIVYYAINYRAYPKGTHVQTFSRQQLSEAKELIENVQNDLTQRTDGLKTGSAGEETISSTLNPDEIYSATISGSKAIESLKIKLEADNLEQALRSTILSIEFDGEKTIWCPVGDFFGTGYQIRNINTWYTRVDTTGLMHALWLMPFKQEATVSIKNIGSQQVKINGDIALRKWTWDKTSMHFGCSWHQFTNLFTREGLTNNDNGNYFDINFVELNGQGVYVGDALTLFNTAYNWWGEGDEKIYIDSDTFPSHFGTGTEDYYGYAWGGDSKAYSNHPYLAQPDATGNAKPGYVVNSRYRGLDALPFNEKLKLDMELWHWQATSINYAPVSFYYLLPGGKSNIKPDYLAAQEKVALEFTDIIPNELKNGKIEAEHMVFSNSCGNKKRSMAMIPDTQFDLSNKVYVKWYDGAPGDTITFYFYSNVEGEYKLQSGFVGGKFYGDYQINFNGKKLNHKINLYESEPHYKKKTIGAVYLKTGENKIEFIIAEEQQGYPEWAPNYFSLDYLEFTEMR